MTNDLTNNLIKEEQEKRLEAVFEDLIKNIDLEQQPPFFPMLLAIREVVAEVVQRSVEKTLDLDAMGMIMSQMNKLQRDHPKAVVVFDTERRRVEITYPLPPDFYKLTNLKPLDE